MKITGQHKQHLAIFLVTGVAAVMLLGFGGALKAQEAKTNSPAKATVPPAQQTAPSPASKSQVSTVKKAGPAASNQKVKSRKELSGAELYSMHCARCHPERYPNERTAAQWKTIGLHMRVRANLPADQFRKVLKYLQDNSGYGY